MKLTWLDILLLPLWLLFIGGAVRAVYRWFARTLGPDRYREEEDA